MDVEEMKGSTLEAMAQAAEEAAAAATTAVVSGRSLLDTQLDLEQKLTVLEQNLQRFANLDQQINMSPFPTASVGRAAGQSRAAEQEQGRAGQSRAAEQEQGRGRRPEQGRRPEPMIVRREPGMWDKIPIDSMDQMGNVVKLLNGTGELRQMSTVCRSTPVPFHNLTTLTI